MWNSRRCERIYALDFYDEFRIEEDRCASKSGQRSTCVFAISSSRTYSEVVEFTLGETNFS